MKFDVLSIVYWVALSAWFIFGYIIELGAGVLSVAMTCLLVIFVVIGIKFFWQ